MKYSVASIDLDRNKKDIILLWKNNFPHLPQERYDWIYQKNPEGKAFSWIAFESESGSSVGAVSLFPRKMKVMGRRVSVGIAGDFAVNQEHRGLNAALKLQRALVTSRSQNGFEFIYGISNKKTEPVQLRVGYIKLGKIERWAKLLKSRNYLKPSSLHWLLSRPLDYVMRKLSRETRYQRSESYSVQSIDFFDPRFDLFWEKASKQFKIIGERSREYLNWRYVKSPHQNYQVFSLIQKDNQEVLGYIVYYLQDEVVYVVDILFSDFDFILESLLAEFILCLRVQEVGSISILLFGCPLLAKKLKSFGFYPREEESSILIYLDKSSPCADIVLQGSNWLLLEGDRDI
jgi:hypothetical protein